MEEQIRVLSLDDDPGDSELLRRHLTQTPDWIAEFRSATTIRDALTRLVAEPPDIVFLDYQIGAHTGLEAFARVRESGWDGPVIFLTAHGDEAVAVEAMHRGASDYLRKDALSASSLRRSVGNAIDKDALRKAVESHRRDLEKTNATLRERNEEIRQFYQVLSHELRTPLAAAREFISLVLDGVGGTPAPEHERMLTIAQESCDELAAHVNDLLEVTRLDTGKMEIRPEPVDPGLVLRNVLAVFEVLGQDSPTRFRLLVEPDLPPVQADPLRLRQILENLVRNAIKFAGDGEIRLRARAPVAAPGFVEFRVEDEGPGIPEEDRPHVFERLFQSRRPEEGSRGLGIGLHICRELVGLHGGRIAVECRPGEGSEFSFTIPVATAVPVGAVADPSVR